MDKEDFSRLTFCIIISVTSDLLILTKPMKKILFLLLFFPVATFAFDDCPKGKTDSSCEYPGECGKYVDENGNEICDHSELAPVLEKTTGVENSGEGFAQNTDSTGKEKRKSTYNFIPLIIILLAIYFATWFLAKKKKIKLLTHRRIWNNLLLITFLIAGLTGIYLVLRINYGFVINFPFNALYWHVEMGIAMSIITIFHTAWHWRYFASMFQRKEK